MLRARLQDFGHDYGDFTTHNGLWEMAEKTADDGLARMALVPRVLEARRLDVTPGMIVKLRALATMRPPTSSKPSCTSEVAHVPAGSRWYRWHCERADVEPRARFRELLHEYASGVLHNRSAPGAAAKRFRYRAGKPAGCRRLTVIAGCQCLRHTADVPAGGSP